MCTVTIMRMAEFEDRSSVSSVESARNHFIRIACNRDESRTRPAAIPPEVRRLGFRQAIMPIDPVSNGTWIGVNDAGLFATLLNSYVGVAVVRIEQDRLGRYVAAQLPNPFENRSSRGDIVSRVLESDSLEGARRIALSLSAATYPPFRLVVTDGLDVQEFRSNGAQVSSKAMPIQARGTGPAAPPIPVLFTSSGLGDALVEAPRSELLHQWFARSDINPADAFQAPKAKIQSPTHAGSTPSGRGPDIQDAFHAHQWPDRLHLSVCMDRPDAKTVSYTVVELRESEVNMSYYPEGPLNLSSAHRHSLQRVP